jgi:hypothetical protein
MKEKNILKETKDYMLVVGNSIIDNNPIYQLINKEFGIIEIQTTIYPQALMHLSQIQGLLDDYKRESELPALLKPAGAVRDIREARGKRSNPENTPDS